jgi:hypothetical protein
MSETNEPRLQIEAVLLIDGEKKAQIFATSVESLEEKLRIFEKIEQQFNNDDFDDKSPYGEL